MRYIHFLWLVGLMSTLPYFMIAQNLEVQVDKLYQVETSSPGFSVAVFQGDQVLLERQYGVANLDYDVPVNQETVFDVGSIGKQFTAAAILLLEEAGKLSIQDPAYQYIEDLPRYELGDPTIEQLLNQTSGIPEVDPYFGVVDLSWNDLLTQTRMMNIILNIPQLNFAPGTYFEYTNVNYVLLAQIVEQVSGQSFSDYLQASIFEPLGMDHTIKMNSTYSIVKDRAIGYIEDEGDFYKTHLHGAIYNGDGQISTTAADLFKWHSGIQKSTIGTPEMWA
ncbi:MAG: serine hydrolase domain-containing protein, partial [Bacteroidota bacterium]